MVCLVSMLLIGTLTLVPERTQLIKALHFVLGLVFSWSAVLALFTWEFAGIAQSKSPSKLHDAFWGTDEAGQVFSNLWRKLWWPFDALHEPMVLVIVVSGAAAAPYFSYMVAYHA